MIMRNALEIIDAMPEWDASWNENLPYFIIPADLYGQYLYLHNIIYIPSEDPYETPILQFTISTIQNDNNTQIIGDFINILNQNPDADIIFYDSDNNSCYSLESIALGYPTTYYEEPHLELFIKY